MPRALNYFELLNQAAGTGAVARFSLDPHRGEIVGDRRHNIVSEKLAERESARLPLISKLSCSSCRPNAPFAELLCFSRTSVAQEAYMEWSGNRWVSE
jgi:hypothetical protein